MFIYEPWFLGTFTAIGLFALLTLLVYCEWMRFPDFDGFVKMLFVLFVGFFACVLCGVGVYKERKIDYLPPETITVTHISPYSGKNCGGGILIDCKEIPGRSFIFEQTAWTPRDIGPDTVLEVKRRGKTIERAKVIN